MSALADLVLVEDKIMFQEFGTFKKKHRKEYTAINNLSGEEICYPARDAIVFIPVDSIKKAVKELSISKYIEEKSGGKSNGWTYAVYAA